MHIALALAALYLIVWTINRACAKIVKASENRHTPMTWNVGVERYVWKKDNVDIPARTGHRVTVQDTISGKVHSLPDVVGLSINRPKNPQLN